MYENLIYSSNKASIKDISKAENRIGYKLPDAYVSFCRVYNGAKLKHAKTSVPKDNQYEVRCFVPIETVGISNVELWDVSLVAIAEDSGGNFFVLKKPDLNSVYFWDHETDDLELLCDTFDVFLNLIEEDDYSDVPKAQNATGWINPAFLKKQKDLGNA